MEDNKISITKRKVQRKLLEKLENAKLNLIYTELDELNINHRDNYRNVKELKKDLRRSLNGLDYNKVLSIIDKINNSLDKMVNDLGKGSTNAFTKLMTSNLSKTIAKTLGITLAGRTALILAPTLGTKALVSTGLAAIGLYRIVKNRKEIIKVNENNEINNILMDLETTKDNDKYIDTRFSEEIQAEIRKWLKENNIKFDDTGYRSLRATIYNLDMDKKRGLCTYLNSRMGRGIEIEERLKKSRKKLNVIASTAATASAGAVTGINIATTINSVDPAIAAGLLNGTVLGAWIESQTSDTWYGILSGGIGAIGTEVLENLPVVGEFAENIFATENLATFAAAGAVGGVVVSTALSLVSSAKKIFNYARNKKENEAFLDLDYDKYGEQDKEELTIIREKLKEPSNMMETIIIDIVLGYLKDVGVDLDTTPKSIYDLKEAINSIKDYRYQLTAQEILKKVEHNLSNPKFSNELLKAGKISIGLFTAGLAAMSVYDIIKGGTFLPELSKQLFPKDNVFNPVEVPDGMDKPLDSIEDSEAIERNTRLYNELQDEKYFVEDDGNATIEYGSNYAKRNQGGNILADANNDAAGAYIVGAGLNMNAWDRFLSLFGIESQKQMIPNMTAICDKLDTLSPERLLMFYRQFNQMPDDGSAIYKALHEALSYSSYLEKVTNYIHGFQATKELHESIIQLSSLIGNGMIPISTALEMLKVAEKKKTDDEFIVEDYEIKEAIKK